MIDYVILGLLVARSALDAINRRIQRKVYEAMNERMDAHGEHLGVHDRRIEIAQRHLESLTRRIDVQNERLARLETDGK